MFKYFAQLAWLGIATYFSGRGISLAYVSAERFFSQGYTLYGCVLVFLIGTIVLLDVLIIKGVYSVLRLLWKSRHASE